MLDYISLPETVFEKIASFAFIDISGKTLHSANNISQEINVTYLPRGIYFLQVRGKDGSTVVKKFLKN